MKKFTNTQGVIKIRKFHADGLSIQEISARLDLDPVYVAKFVEAPPLRPSEDDDED